ncbi:MAG: acylphosphatase [Salinivirgaceae bacterium]|jgi:acylphosphatase|nr:acylphosphatase [Salinivirgaceae bacterium]
MDTVESHQITIKGRVQNVGFRYHTYEKAIQLGIKGFVMNKANGNVYVEAEGDTLAITEFLSWCHKGPNWARVNEVISTKQPLMNFTTFQIKR